VINKQARAKLYAYATKKLGLRDYTRGWMKGNCPECGRIDKFGFNIGQNRTNCFVCTYHPSPITMVMDMEGLSTHAEAWAFLKMYEGRQYLEPVIERLEQIDAVLPDGFKSLIIGDGLLAKKARSYVKGRGFDPEDMAYKGWGYVNRGDYYGYIIIPFYIGGKLVYYNARRYLGSGPKYMNPSIEDFGLGKSLILYNVDALAIQDYIYLAEGAINAETIGDEGIATGGKKVSNYQISMILKSDVKGVTILLDPDAMSDSIRVAMELCYHKKVRVIELPEETDINSLGKKKTLKMVKQVSWMSYNDLIKMNNEKGS